MYSKIRWFSPNNWYIIGVICVYLEKYKWNILKKCKSEKKLLDKAYMMHRFSVAQYVYLRVTRSFIKFFLVRVIRWISSNGQSCHQLDFRINTISLK